MQCGILRIKPISKGGISNIGKEEDRINQNGRNPDIDPERSGLNMTADYRDSKKKTLYRSLQDKYEELAVDYPRGKGSVAMEQAVISASPEFFRDLGWDRESARHWSQTDIPDAIVDYFNTALAWANNYFGASNIISATIHFDETTPHVHIDYIPCVEASSKRKDVYARDENGNLIRDERGHAVRARDDNGKVIYRYEDAPRRVNHTDYWQQRGGRQSYRKMQDDFYKNVSSRYGLERGEIDSGREHIEQEKYKAQQAMHEARAAVSYKIHAESTASEALKNASDAVSAATKAQAQAEAAKAEQHEAERAAAAAIETARKEEALLLPLQGEVHTKVDAIIDKAPKISFTGKETYTISKDEMTIIKALRGLLRVSERRLQGQEKMYQDLQTRYETTCSDLDRQKKETVKERSRADRLETELNRLKTAISRFPCKVQEQIQSIVNDIRQSEILQAMGRRSRQ